MATKTNITLLCIALCGYGFIANNQCLAMQQPAQNQPAAEHAINLHELPRDVQGFIISYLPQRDTGNAHKVCRAWRFAWDTFRRIYISSKQYSIANLTIKLNSLLTFLQCVNARNPVRLNLSNCSLRKNSAKKFERLIKIFAALPGSQELNAYGCYFTPEEIAKIDECTQLQELDLSWNKPKLTTLPEQITQLTKLKKLYLYGNKFGPEEQACIRQLLPHAEIYF